LLRPPEGSRCARRVGSRLPALPAEWSGRWMRVSSEDLPSNHDQPRKRPQCKHCSHEMPSQRFFRLFIGAALTLVLPPLRDTSPRNRRPRATRQAQAATSNGAKLPPSTLSVGYTDAADGCPPMTPACQRKQTASALDSQPGMPGRRGSRSGLHRDVAATGSIPADPTEQEARVLPERRACRVWISHHECSAPLFGDAPRDPRRNPVAPATSTRVPAGNLRCQRKLSVPQTCCHARDGPACSPPNDGNPTQPNHESNEPKPALSALQLHRAASTRTPMPTDT
jgi:hypothetical protein